MNRILIAIMALTICAPSVHAGDMAGIGKYANEKWGWNDKTSHRVVHGVGCATMHTYFRANGMGFWLSALVTGSASAIVGEIKERKDRPHKDRRDRNANFEGCAAGIATAESVGQVTRMYVIPQVAPDRVGVFFNIDF